MKQLPFYPNQHGHYHNRTVHSYAMTDYFVPTHALGGSNFLLYALLKMFLTHKSTILDA